MKLDCNKVLIDTQILPVFDAIYESKVIFRLVATLEDLYLTCGLGYRLFLGKARAGCRAQYVTDSLLLLDTADNYIVAEGYGLYQWL